MWVEIFKNADVSYLLTTTEMPRATDRPFLRARLKFFPVWCHTVPNKHSALQNTLNQKIYMYLYHSLYTYTCDYLTLSYLSIN